MDIQQTQFLTKAEQQAEQAGHIFPEMAACEAALESNYGTSALAIQARNLFGIKLHQYAPSIVRPLSLPTREFIHGEWVTQSADWVVYPDQAACFADRVAILKRMAPGWPHYAAALAATDPITYVTEVSKSWSTDPNRANKVIAIYKERYELGRVPQQEA